MWSTLRLSKAGGATALAIVGTPYWNASCDEDASKKTENVLDTRDIDANDDTFGLKKTVIEEMKTPTQWSRWHDEVHMVTSGAMNTSFKGFKVDLNKAITPNFLISHKVTLGGSPSGQESAHYQLGAQVANEQFVLASNVDHNGGVEANFILPNTQAVGITEFPMSLITIAIFRPDDPKGDMAWADLNYENDNCTASLRLGNNVPNNRVAAPVPGSTVGFTYTQAVTPRWSLGGEAHLNLTPGSAQVAATAKYDTPEWLALGSWQSVPQDDMNLSVLTAQYLRKVLPGRVRLGAELMMIPANLHMEATFGAEFQLHQGTVTTSVNADGRMASVIETKLAQGVRMTLTGEAGFGIQDPQTGQTGDQFKFGYGVTVG